MKRPGPKIKDFDWHLVDSLLGLNASLEYVCEKLIEKDGDEVNKKTIVAKKRMVDRRIKERHNCRFSEYRDRKLEPLRMNLFKKQIELALKGNVPMLIWMGKQLLGQTDVEKSQVKRIEDQISTMNEKINILQVVKSA